VTDTVGSFSFLVTGSQGDNGSCQINGGTASFVGSCTGHNSDGTGFSNGHDDTNHPGTNPPTLVTFNAISGQCTADHPCTVDLGFVSIQGTLTVAAPGPIPGAGSPSMAVVLGGGLLGWWRRRRQEQQLLQAQPSEQPHGRTTQGKTVALFSCRPRDSQRIGRLFNSFESHTICAGLSALFFSVAEK
jgi:hypothetical protein